MDFSDPRVRLSIPLAHAPESAEELPFVVGVLANLSGHAERRPALLQRLFLSVNADNFDQLLALVEPRLTITVPELAQRSLPRTLKLTFETLDDFGPSRIVERVSFLQPLLDQRRQLLRGASSPEEVAEIDAQLSAQVAVILSHPDFVRLEGTWRGLHFLVYQTPAHPLLKIKVLNVTWEELRNDFTRGSDWHQTRFYQLLCRDGPFTEGGEPFALLLADFDFTHAPQEVQMLRTFADIAAERHLVFVASVSSHLFGLVRWQDLRPLRDLNKIVTDPSYGAWNAFRGYDAAAHAVLTLPRVLARMPYGPIGLRATAFDYVEATPIEHPSRCCWMSSAWVYAHVVANAFVRNGWLLATRGSKESAQVTTLPVAPHTHDNGAPILSSLELPLGEMRLVELAHLGLLPLLHATGNRAGFANATSCLRPVMHFEPEAMAAEHVRGQVNYLHCGLLVARSLRRLGETGQARSLTPGDAETWLNGWLGTFVGPAEDSRTDQYRRPLSLGRVEARAVAGQAEARHLTVTLGLALDNPGGADVPLRLEVRISAPTD